MSDHKPDNVSYDNKKSYIVGIPLSPSTLYVDNPDQSRTNVPPTDLNVNKKRASFQITSVTVQGSRTNNEEMEDSADEESHTDDISSDMLDSSSKVTEGDDYASEANTNCDDMSPCGPLLITSLTSPASESEINVGLGIDMSPPYGPNIVTGGVTRMTNSLDSPASAPVPIINQLPDNWQHRFKVVKIVSSEPFKRGRWLCMDFKDPPQSAHQQDRKVTDVPVIQVTPCVDDHNKTNVLVPSEQHSNTVAHVFEIPITDSHHQSQLQNQANQSLYGIFLPHLLDNGSNQYITVNPVTILHDFPTDVNFNMIDPGNSEHFYNFDNLSNNFVNGGHQPPMSNHNNNQFQNGDQGTTINNTFDIPTNNKHHQQGNYFISDDIESRFSSFANELWRSSGLPLPTLNGSHFDVSQKPPIVANSNQQTVPNARSSNSVPVASFDFCSSASSTGASTVAIDNKIEQAMDLVKSHLMFAVREEVEVLKEKITELLERISQLEHENDILRANASPETLKQLNQSQKFSGQPIGKQQSAHIQSQPPAS